MGRVYLGSASAAGRRFETLHSLFRRRMPLHFSARSYGPLNAWWDSEFPGFGLLIRDAIILFWVA